MMRTSATRMAAAGAAVAALVGSALVVLAPLAQADEIVSNIARGGRLYDDWHTELNVRMRSISSLPDPEIRGAAARGRGRCVTCHGWDYQGVPWTEGGSLSGMAGADPDDIIAVLSDETHGYGTYMDETDLRDVALFVSQGQADMDAMVDRDSGQARGDAEAGAVYVQSICAGCHGPVGMEVADMPPLGPFSRDEPWHALHVMLNGHPNGSMPPLRVLEPSVLADILAALQAMPDRPEIAAVTRGGRLYDSWPDEIGRPVPRGWHPAYPDSLRARARAEVEGDVGLTAAQRRSWQCHACHGWDYRGRDGMALGGPPAPFIGINGKDGADPSEIIAILTDETHDYGRLLSARDLEDLAMFVSRGQIDMAPRIHPDTGQFLADGSDFEGHYFTICATCHGADGRDIRTMPPLGRAITRQPQHALHSVFNGHPGEAMPPLRAMGLDTATGILAFAETLPIRKDE